MTRNNASIAGEKGTARPLTQRVSGMRVIHVLPDLDADGPEQMCRDEALLAVGPTPCLRLYRFAPPTLSLGYFQDFAAINATLPLPMPIVRRITGGGTIWHEHEITYAVVVEAGVDGLPQRTADLYPLLHGHIAAVLAQENIVAQRQAVTVGDRRYHAEPRCFASPAADDLISGSGKMLGSAARTRGPRVLVHGSLKLATNPWDGPAVSGCGLDATSAASALRRGLIAALGGDAVEVAWPDEVQEETRRLRALRYATDAWTRNREGPRP